MSEGDAAAIRELRTQLARAAATIRTLEEESGIEAERWRKAAQAAEERANRAEWHLNRAKERLAKLYDAWRTVVENSEARVDASERLRVEQLGRIADVLRILLA